jgi:ferredoxin, 2Fe-2S
MICRVTWQHADGRSQTEEVPIGVNLMEGAQMHRIAGIAGECGGCLSCATCHVVVDSAWADRHPALCAKTDTEDMMLDITPAPRQATSRLSCQIVASSELDGLVLHIPEEI